MRRLLVLGLAVIAALSVACSSLGTKPKGSPENPIKMAMVPFLETQRLARGMQSLSDELKKETGLTYTGEVPTSYAAVVEAMCAGRVDSGINSLEDLRGKRFAWVDPSSTSGYLFPRALLQAQGIAPEMFAQQMFAGGHDKVAIAVLDRQVEGGALGKDVLPRLTSTYPRVMEEIKTLEESPDIPNDGVAFRKELPADIVQKTREALLRISAREDGQKLFEDAIGTRGVAETTDAAYEPVRRAAAVLNLDLETELSKPK